MDWGLATIIGPIILVGAIAWALMRNKKDSSAADERRTERATHDLYDKSDAEDEKDAQRGPLG